MIEFSQDYDLTSHNVTYVVSVNFIHEWRDPQSKSQLRMTDFQETFHDNLIYCHDFFARNVLTGSRVRNIDEEYSYFGLLELSNMGFEPWPNT